ncbi:sensor histidine kinase [Acrocarpospora phusangensis]|nr:ATP-binding protein [Acrocarpospora phusangensis]
MSRFAAMMRGSVAVVVVPGALLMSGPGVSPIWLAAALTLFCAWTAGYVRICWTRGLAAWVIAVDVATGCALCLLLPRLVTPSLIVDGASWVAAVASLVAICAQLAGRPLLSIPAGLLVTAAYLTGAGLTDTPGGGVPHALTLTIQTFVAAAAMIVATRTGVAASHAFTALQREEREAEIEAAERADALTQLRLVHNGPLTTLTMALHAEAARPSEVLRRHATANLTELPRLAAAPRDRAQDVRLDERLAQVAVWHEPQLRVTATTRPCLVPEPVADSFGAAVRECLENVVRHARVTEAGVTLAEHDGEVVVTVTDQGVGFVPGQVPASTFGLRGAVVAAMAQAGGGAAIESAPGAGTRVELRWRRG